jgi:hypothetical protein
MFCYPKGAAFRRHSNRTTFSGLLTQLNLKSFQPQGYSSIRVLLLGFTLLPDGGISE